MMMMMRHHHHLHFSCTLGMNPIISPGNINGGIKKMMIYVMVIIYPIHVFGA
jgi:hypothetical protein